MVKKHICLSLSSQQFHALSLATSPYTFRVERDIPLPTIGDAFRELYALQGVDTREVLEWFKDFEDTNFHKLEQRYLRWAASLDTAEKKACFAS